MRKNFCRWPSTMKTKPTKYLLWCINGVSLYSWVVIAAKIKPGKNLTNKIFYFRKIPNLRYLPACVAITSKDRWAKAVGELLTCSRNSPTQVLGTLLPWSRKEWPLATYWIIKFYWRKRLPTRIILEYQIFRRVPSKNISTTKKGCYDNQYLPW